MPKGNCKLLRALLKDNTGRKTQCSFVEYEWQIVKNEQWYKRFVASDILRARKFSKFRY